MTEIPEGFEERQKSEVVYDTPDFPAVSYNPETGDLHLLKLARQTIGDPEYVRLFWKGDQVAVIPTHEEHDNAYSVTDGSVSVNWVGRKLDFTPEQGRYRALDGDGMLIVDFSDGPLNHDR